MNLPSMHDSLAVKMPDPNMAFTTVHCVYKYRTVYSTYKTQ